jgi:hypothetical protein
MHLGVKGTARNLQKMCLLKNVTKCMNYLRHLSLFYGHTKDKITSTS